MKLLLPFLLFLGEQDPICEAITTISTVVPVDDVDRDGLRDLLVGTASGVEGRVCVLSARDGSVLKELVPSGTGTLFGYAACSVGDLDADGFADVAVTTLASGASSSLWELHRSWSEALPELSSLENASGCVEFFSVGSGKTLGRYVSPGPNDSFGYALAYLGELDGDPVVAVGAPGGEHEGGVESGRVFLVSAESRSSIRSFSAPEDEGDPNAKKQPDDAFGWSLAKVSDVDGDGYPELLVGAPRHGQEEHVRAGSCYLASTIDGRLHWRFDSQADHDSDFGEVVVCLDLPGKGEVLAARSHQDGVQVMSTVGSYLGFLTSLYPGLVTGFGDSLLMIDNERGEPLLLVGACEYPKDTDPYGVYVYPWSSVIARWASASERDVMPDRLLRSAGGKDSPGEPALDSAGHGIVVRAYGDWNGDGHDDVLVWDPYAARIRIVSVEGDRLLVDLGVSSMNEALGSSSANAEPEAPR